MRLSFSNFWPLFFVLLIPYFWRVQKASVIDFDPKQLTLLTVIRSAIALLLVLALMRPAVTQSTAAISVVYVVDVSQSIAPQAMQSAITWIQQANDIGQPVHARYVAFGRNSRVFDTLDGLKHAPVIGGRSESAVNQSGTDIESALAQALRTFEPNTIKRLVLVSDGIETSGNMMGLLRSLRAGGIRVYTRPADTRASGDARIEAIVAPAAVTAEEEFPVEVHVYSDADTAGQVDLKSGGMPLESRNVQLKQGMNRIAFHTRITGTAGAVTLEASLGTSSDTFAANNIYRQSIVVAGRPQVLYIEGHVESARYLKDALTQEGIGVESTGPAGLPADLAGMNAYDAIVLSDVDRKSITDEQMKSLASYVHDLGGGFLLAGGENNYGEGGYSKTVIEDALPVTFDVRKPDSVAMVVVLDRSGSMGASSGGATRMELAREATKAPVALLKDTDHFGVIAFDSNFRTIVALGPTTDRPRILRDIGSIQAGGNTSIYPALREAYVQLAEDASEIKHVIMLTDGKDTAAFPTLFQDLTEKMSAEGITVSTVAVGVDSDRELLADIARWGHGRAYYMDNPAKVPQVFSEDAEIAKNAVQETAFKPTIKKTVEAFKGIDFSTAPELLGYVRTKPKPTADVLMEATGSNPLLARWQYGLGWSAAFTSDVKDRWAVGWLSWKDYPKFWSQLIRETMRRREDNNFSMRVVRDGDAANVSIDAIDDGGHFRNKLAPAIHVVAPDQSVSIYDAAQVGPGDYKARIDLEQEGDYLFKAAGAETGEASRVLAYSYPDEFHFQAPDTAKLKRISLETGGAYLPEPREIFNTQGDAAVALIPLWPYAATFALGLYFVDLLLRRIRLFEANDWR